MFTDFNPERTGDPFIVFPVPPTEAIDRRSFPTVAATGAVVDRVVATALPVGGTPRAVTAGVAPVTGYVAAGSVEIAVDGSASRRVDSGASFAVPAGKTARITAPTGPARIVTFVLTGAR